MTIAGRSPGVLLLAALTALLGIASLYLTLQFLDVVEAGARSLDFWGGKWAGVFLYGLTAAVAIACAYGWLMGQQWARIITILLALIGITNATSAYFAGTKAFSTVLVPLALSIIVLVLAVTTSQPPVQPAAKKAKTKPVTKPPVPATRADQV